MPGARHRLSASRRTCCPAWNTWPDCRTISRFQNGSWILNPRLLNSVTLNHFRKLVCLLTCRRQRRSPITRNASQWVVAGGARDSYQVPIALCESQLLRWFVTDFYAPFDRFPLRWGSDLLPRSIAHKLKCRYSPDLPSRFVKSYPSALLSKSKRDGWIHYNRVLGEHAEIWQRVLDAASSAMPMWRPTRFAELKSFRKC